jgi:hypothetical protein
MKTKTMDIQEVLRNGNSTVNQGIKGKFIAREVFCNVNSLVEFSINSGDGDAPVTIDDIENMYSLPEWSATVLGESLYFAGGSDSDRNTFLEEFDRLKDETEELFEKEEISETTYEHNLEIIEENRREVEDLESEPQDIMEWWAVSEFLYRKLKEKGHPVADAGSCYVWGRCTSGQAILLDYVITEICAEMGILEGQENAWS